MRERFRGIGRGLRRRCPRCGARDVFASYFELKPRCPRCGLRFEREEGYWLGAMVVNIAVAEALFGALFVGGMLATWPDVPWTALLIAGLALNAIVPIAFYPHSKTVWLGVDLLFNPASPSEEADAARARDPGLED